MRWFSVCRAVILRAMEHNLADFSSLTPDAVLQLVESALGVRASNLCRTLTSYINRVYDVKLDDESWVVAKFYRPGRWNRDALQDEQDFLTELAAAELPVIAPVKGTNGQTLHEHAGLFFSIFPKKGGRPVDEFNDDQWREFGRLMARVHNVGGQHAPRNRIVIHPEISTSDHLEAILAVEFPFEGLKREFEDAVEDLIEQIAPMFDDIEEIRIHGDCHVANMLQRPGEAIYLIDFDDMGVGPAVQDLWMMLPGHRRDMGHQLNLLLEGYETFRDFNHAELRLIEPLRAMRFIHFMAWCARQKADGGFARLAPDWGTSAYWKQEIHDLRKQMQEIKDHEAER
jgi:Ser/Thr protein kinase RdoA (MazF antagonist)